uniref:Uncharacterized protein n=1 Tax=viral metagenome TaxID=1070528 RepID=A0A6H1ZQF9_9ZZZZ
MLDFLKKVCYKMSPNNETIKLESDVSKLKSSLISSIYIIDDIKNNNLKDILKESLQPLLFKILKELRTLTYLLENNDERL